MSPDEFKAETRRRGWTFRALAARWGKSETWVSKIANNPERDKHWDDAVNGLPAANTSAVFDADCSPKV